MYIFGGFLFGLFFSPVEFVNVQAADHCVGGGNGDDNNSDNDDDDEDEGWTRDNAQGVRFIVKAPSVYHQHRPELRQINFTV